MPDEPRNHLRELTEFLEKLHDKKVPYTLSGDVATSIMVCLALPGERWEVNYYDDGDIGVEIFKSDGRSFDGSKMAEFFERWDEEDETGGPNHGHRPSERSPGFSELH